MSLKKIFIRAAHFLQPKGAAKIVSPIIPSRHLGAEAPGFIPVILLSFCLFMWLLGCKSNQHQQPEPETKFIDSTTLQSIIHMQNTGIDISPMDICYFPADFPKNKMANSKIAGPLARVIYSRPHLQGRRLFSDILKYGQIWRLGANEATEIQLFEDATINNQKIAKGTYIMYCIPQEKSWTIVFNTNLYSWGLQPDVAKDVLKITASVKTITHEREYFTIAFQEPYQQKTAVLVMAWENIEASITIKF